MPSLKDRIMKAAEFEEREFLRAEGMAYQLYQEAYTKALKSSVVKQMADALRKVCERNNIPEALESYYGECSMALAAYYEAIKERGE